jgi:hypothetical protein
MTSIFPDVECKKCAHSEPSNCPWLRFPPDDKNRITIHLKSGDEIIFSVICFSGYGD